MTTTNTIPSRPGHPVPAAALFDAGYGEELVLLRRGEKKPKYQDWTKRQTTRDEVASLGAGNVGLRTRYFPTVDIDITDERIAQTVASIVEARFPGAFPRIGNPPKMAYLFRLPKGAAPFKKRRLPLKIGDTQQQVEILGDGQQCVVSGIHPDTGRPYGWPQGVPVAAALPELTEEEAVTLLEEIRAHLSTLGIECGPASGGGARSDRSHIDQQGLKAPTLELLRKLVSTLPNEYEERDDYIKIGCAVKAAGAEWPEVARELFYTWAMKWEGGDGNAPETVERDWESLKPPFNLGWSFLVDEAKKRGTLPEEVRRAELDAFDPLPEEESPSGDEGRRRRIHVRMAALNLREHMNDEGNALRFVAFCGDHVRFNEGREVWVAWDGRRWKIDTARTRVDRLASNAMYAFVAAAPVNMELRDKLLPFAITSLNAQPLRRMLERAQSLVAVGNDAFDADPYLINFNNGTFDIRTGSLRPHNPADLITRVIPYDYMPAAACPTWLQVLSTAMGGREEMVAYLKRAFGYSATGITREKAFFVCHGPSGTGKTTVLGAVGEILNDYATTVQIESLMERGGYESSNANADLADLNGARFALTSETDRASCFNEALVKRITQGGGTMKQARKYENHVRFKETHKLWIDANHMPATRDGMGLFERLRRVPFDQVITNPDNSLRERLKAEYAAIASWIADGAREWYEVGLADPALVNSASSEYRKEQDSISAWAAERLVSDPDGRESIKALRASYQDFCQEAGKRPVDDLRFQEGLKKLGLEKARMPKTGDSARAGIRLKPTEFDAVQQLM